MGFEEGSVEKWLLNVFIAMYEGAQAVVRTTE